MQNNSNTQHEINIIYPKELGIAWPEALALCEMVISSLIKAKPKEICCKVNSDFGYVECDVAEIKNILTLLLKTKKIRDFYEQFIHLLHKSENSAHSNCLGQLKVVKDNLLLNISITEEGVFPNFKWKIVKCIQIG